MRYVLLIIGSLLLLSAGKGVWEEEKEKVVLREEQQRLAVEVLSLYLEVDSNRVAEYVASYLDVLVDLLRCCIQAEEYEKAIEVGEEWCGRMEEDDEGYVAGMVVLGKLYGQVGMTNKQKRCFRLVKNSALFEKLNAMSLGELCK